MSCEEQIEDIRRDYGLTILPDGTVLRGHVDRNLGPKLSKAVAPALQRPTSAKSPRKKQ